MIDIDTEAFNQNLDLMNKFGKFDFEIEKYLPQYMDADLDTRLMERIDTNSAGHKWYYIGQFIRGTVTKHGAGITIWSHGEILEGYYKHGKPFGKVRRIYKTGN